MSTEIEELFREILDGVNMADFAEWAGRPYRTVQSWKLGDRRLPPEALTELADYLRSRARALVADAIRLESAAEFTTGGHE